MYLTTWRENSVAAFVWVSVVPRVTLFIGLEQSDQLAILFFQHLAIYLK